MKEFAPKRSKFFQLRVAPSEMGEFFLPLLQVSLLTMTKSARYALLKQPLSETAIISVL